MKGYFNKPEQTKEVFDEMGFFHTGDVAYYDEDGHYYIVDRIKELIKVKGFQVAPAELEALLLTHPMVNDAAVVSTPDEEHGELPKAFIVLKPNVTKSPEVEQDILKFVADKVIHYKRIRTLEFVEVIQKSPSGKILRRILKEKEKQKYEAQRKAKL